MSHLVLRSEKSQWESPYRNGGWLELMEINYDGRRWYRIIAVGPEMKDNLIRFGFPTNIDHIEFLEDAEDVFESLRRGPNSNGDLRIPMFLGDLERSGKIEGRTPNLYIDNDLQEKGEGVVGIVRSGGVIDKLAGPGGIVSLNAKKIRDKFRSWNVSEEAAWNSTIKHEFKHFSDHLQYAGDMTKKSDETIAVKVGIEAMLESGAEISMIVMRSHLLSYGLTETQASENVRRWIKEWSEKYSWYQNIQ